MPFDDTLALIAKLAPENPRNIALQAFDPAYFAGLDADAQARMMAEMGT